MDFIISLAHFCELHGPTSIVCTQISPESTVPTATGNSCASCTFNVPIRTPHSSTNPVLRTKLEVNEEKTQRQNSVEPFPDFDGSDEFEDAAIEDEDPELNFITVRPSPSLSIYPLLRNACMRILSIETLPVGMHEGPMTIDIAGSGEYEDEDERTLAIGYLFKVTDPTARGRRRTYAFIALAGSRGWVLQHQIHETFKQWAHEIKSQAQQALDQQALFLSPQPFSSFRQPFSLSHMGGEQSVNGASTSGETSPGSVTKDSIAFSDSGSATARLNSRAPSPENVRISNRNITPVSSFLSAKMVDPDGFPRSNLMYSNMSKPRSLTEVTGDEWFFAWLHTEFCGLLNGLMEE
ncbi:hypothetical protein M8818_000132 [Zalaria obscura]|uniref:Uncharacterized protein n=1 Tax=Zalaria obscura TaxID=2024903 RepID=A0ACC3SPJ0_9PEZI